MVKVKPAVFKPKLLTDFLQPNKPKTLYCHQRKENVPLETCLENIALQPAAENKHAPDKTTHTQAERPITLGN